MSARGGSSRRPPFDPSRMRSDADDPGLFGHRRGEEGPAVLTVSELTRLVRGAIQKALQGDIHVVGEISNVSSPSGGHLYWTLKDETSEVRCVMWRSSARSLRFRPTDGLEVVATGSVDVYEPRGQYQLYVRRLEPRGIGAMELAMRQLKEQLEREGLFDPRRKRPLPKFPERVAVVTSPTGAAIRDILQTLRRRYPCVRVYLFGVRVQGEGAAKEIADAVRRVNHSSRALGGIDAMIVGRGGGSLEDLWAFNEEAVARAIHASRIPVVSAVGHEVDFVISDFVADVRAETPTAAVERVVPDLTELLREFDAGRHRLGQAVGRVAEAARLRLTALERSEWFRDPVGRIRQRGQGVDEAARRLFLVVHHGLQRRKSDLHGLEARLVRGRPENVLARRRETLMRAEHRLRWAEARTLQAFDRALGEVATRLTAVQPHRLVEQGRILLDQLAGRMHRGMMRRIADHERAVAVLDERLEASSHERILHRGFSVTRRAKTGKLVRRTEDVRDGDRLLTETADGEITSRVIDGQQGELFG